MHLQKVQEAPVFHKLRIDVKELGHADCSGLAHIRIIILQSTPNDFTSESPLTRHG
jgi:hypothetical protein